MASTVRNRRRMPWVPFLQIGATVGVAFLLGMFGSSGCSDDSPGPPEDSSAVASLRLYIEVDYMTGQLDRAEDYIQTFASEVLWGTQGNAYCTYMWGKDNPAIDPQIETDDELFWQTPVPAQIGMENFQDLYAVFTAVSEGLLEPERSQINKHPSLYIVMADYLIGPSTPSRDPDRIGQPWRFDDREVPDHSDVFGWVAFPFSPYELGEVPVGVCSSSMYGTTYPVGIIFRAQIEKSVQELNDVLKRAEFLGDCVFSDGALLNIDRMLARVVGHELLHQMGLPDAEENELLRGTPCHEKDCECILNWNTMGLILRHSDARTQPADSLNCTRAQNYVRKLHELCLGDEFDYAHHTQSCDYNDLDAINPAGY